jgi:hypothetical protein
VPADSKLMGADVELEVWRNKLNLELDDVFFLYKCLQACASLDKESAYPRYSIAKCHANGFLSTLKTLQGEGLVCSQTSLWHILPQPYMSHRNFCLKHHE